MNDTTHIRTCLPGLALFLALTARPADACETSALEQGLTVKEPPQARQIAADGVLAFDAFIRGEPPEVALARFSLTLTPDGGGPAITGEVSHHVLGTAPIGPTEDYQAIVLVWRPGSPLAPGTYGAEVRIAGQLTEKYPWQFPVVVGTAPAPPLSPPHIGSIDATSYVDAELDRVCCELPQSSCGTSSLCLPTRVRLVPGFDVQAWLEQPDRERAFLWVAPWDGKAPGFPFDRVNRWYRDPEQLPWYAEWQGNRELRLPDAAGERCVVVGATSLIDGSTVLAEPVCRELAAAHDEPRTPMFPDPADEWVLPCIGPTVYERDGSPYPPEPEQGCRLAAGPGALAWLLLLARRRRRVTG